MDRKGLYELPSTTTKAKGKYTRTTELRHVHENDLTELSRILEEHDCWRQLMEIIPKRLDAQACSAPNALDYNEAISIDGVKYSSKEMKIIEYAYNRTNTYLSHSQILFEEWKTSGQQNERPTLGVLLQLLTHAELFRAADFVAENMLNESKPKRPNVGPAAPVEMDDDSDMEVDVGNVALPNTNTLNENAHCNYTEDNNKDLFTKHRVIVGKDVVKPVKVAPIPPPRMRPPRRIDPNQSFNGGIMPNIFGIGNATSNSNNESVENWISPTSHNIPNLTVLQDGKMEEQNEAGTSGPSEDSDTTMSESNENSAPSGLNIPMVSLLLNNYNNTNGTETNDLPNTMSTTSSSSSTLVAATDSTNNDASKQNCLPLISALNLAGESVSRSSSVIIGDCSQNDSESSLSNDDDDDNEDDDCDNSLPNLSNLDQRSSNNDSSLTTVTGTSGDNSFELTNDSSSASNDDNIPDLSALQKREK